MVIVIMGVSGVGKSTVGRLVARTLDWPFYEGDDFHSGANKAKMRDGIPLTDEDRWPWLAAIREQIEHVLAQEGHAIFTCSALKRAYRDRLRLDGVQFVHLKGDAGLIRDRVARRKGHFFDPKLLASQFEALEEPMRALVVDVAQPPEAIANEIVRELDLETGDAGRDANA